VYSIAKDGFKLIKPYNGCEMGLGFYVTGSSLLTANYGNFYLVLESSLVYSECLDFDEIVKGQSQNPSLESALTGAGKSPYSGWWTDEHLLAFSFNGATAPWTQKMLEKSWLKANTPNVSPVCVTRASSGHQIKFNFNMEKPATGSEPHFNTVQKFKSDLKVVQVCTNFPKKCYAIQDFLVPETLLGLVTTAINVAAKQVKDLTNMEQEGPLSTVSQKTLDAAKKDVADLTIFKNQLNIPLAPKLTRTTSAPSLKKSSSPLVKPSSPNTRTPVKRSTSTSSLKRKMLLEKNGKLRRQLGSPTA